MSPTISRLDDRTDMYRHAPGRSRRRGRCGRRRMPIRRSAAGELFGLNKVVAVHIEIPADEYQAMQPPAPAGGLGGPSQGPRPKKAGARASERNLFGIEFPWVRGSLTAEGRTYKGVGFRYAGNASYMASAGGLKRSFKVDLDRSQPSRIKWASRGSSPERCTRPDQGPRGPGLRPLPRGGHTRASHGARRGDTHGPRPVRQGVPRPVHPGRAGGSSVPQRSLPHRQGPALEAARASRHRLPR